MGASIGKKGLVSEINVTPFVDVMLVLLIIFMVTAPMMDQGLDVNLPTAKKVDVLPPDSDHLVLTVRQDGTLFLDAYQVPIEELESRLGILVRDKGRMLYLRADSSVPYGLVVDVMGRIKAAGIDKMGVVALPSDTPATATGTAPAPGSRGQNQTSNPPAPARQPQR